MAEQAEILRGAHRQVAFVVRDTFFLQRAPQDGGGFRIVDAGDEHLVIVDGVTKACLARGVGDKGLCLRHEGGHAIVAAGPQGHAQFGMARRDAEDSRAHRSMGDADHPEIVIGETSLTERREPGISRARAGMGETPVSGMESAPSCR